jgi:hypothetical protein
MKHRLLVCVLTAALNHVLCCSAALAQNRHFSDGNDVRKTGLNPKYPEALDCSPLTSLYASWKDVDGTRRDEAHSGVDGGRLGDSILSPAPGTIKAVWKANWGWGEEGALLIRHDKDDLGLTAGPNYYYSEFDHLKFDEIQSIVAGGEVARGQKLATVSRPGGDKQYLPEVHWEVWKLSDDSLTTWQLNKFNGRYWTNPTAHLIDPLYMLSRNTPPAEDGSVLIQPYTGKNHLGGFKGFSYVLPCVAKTSAQDRTEFSRQAQ